MYKTEREKEISIRSALSYSYTGRNISYNLMGFPDIFNCLGKKKYYQIILKTLYNV